MGARDGFVSPGEWLTPTVPNGGRSVPESLVQSKGMTEAGTKRTIDLQAQTMYWSTPKASDGDKGGPNMRGSKGDLPLPSQSAQWMTPSVSNSQGNEYTRDRGQAGQERLTLTGQATQWPTPTASLVNDGEDLESWHARRERVKESAKNGNGMGMPLTIAAQQWPTPASRDFRTPNSQESRKHSGGEQLPNFVEHHFSHPVHSTLDGQPLSPTARTLRRRLNPAFACWLMGWPWWWTNPALTSCARSAMVSYRSRLQLHLSCFFNEQASRDRMAA
jgi:hypothetical protein